MNTQHISLNCCFCRSFLFFFPLFAPSPSICRMVLRNGSTLSSDWSEANGTSAEASTSQAIRVDELDHFDEDWVKPFPLRSGVKVRKGEKFSDYYTLFDEIGEGKFGKVYRCVEKATELVLAAKCIKIRKDTDFEKVEKEVNIMTQMRHKCIAQIYDAFATTDNDVILVMEIVEGGELFDRVADDSYILTEMAVALIMFQICEAIRYIHSQNIIHLDLKPENIMCVSQASNQIKLIDFGLAQWYDGSKDLMFMAGTPEFAAPEVIKYEPLDFHTDMWSLGVIAYILLSGQSPFLGETLAHTYCNVERGSWMFCEEFAENGISSDAKDFISRLLIVEKEKRMLPNACLRHPWIAKNRERALLASRAASPAVCHPLAVDKFRKYVKNKRFRRLVFGVLFINQVMRMVQTMQRNKSAHGVEYVRNMLEAAEAAEAKAGTAATTALEAGMDGGRSELMKAFGEQRKPRIVVEEEKEEEERMDEEDEEGKMKKKEEVDEEKPRKVKKVLVVKRREKRSKAERGTAEQQRTRSSTEQTTSKKQRQEEEQDEGMMKKTGDGGRMKSPMMGQGMRAKCVKFEQKEEEESKSAAEGEMRKRVGGGGGGQVLRMAARMQEEHAGTPSTSSAEPRKAGGAGGNVSSLLKKLEQRGMETKVERGGGGGSGEPMALAVTVIEPQRKKKEDEAEEGTRKKKDEEAEDGRKKVRKLVKKKKVLRVRTAEEEEQRAKRMEEKGGGILRERIKEIERMEGKRKEMNGMMMKREEGMKKREEKVQGGRRRRTEEMGMMRNGHGEDVRRDETKMIGKMNGEVKKQKEEVNKKGESPRTKQRLWQSNSHPLENNSRKGRGRGPSREDESEEESSGWSAVGQDVFDFSLLRTKLQNRILGLKDKEDKAAEAENHHRFELQKQQKMLQTNLNIKRAMRKWISMDKESKQYPQQGTASRLERGQPVVIPDWAM